MQPGCCFLLAVDFYVLEPVVRYITENLLHKIAKQDNLGQILSIRLSLAEDSGQKIKVSLFVLLHHLCIIFMVWYGVTKYRSRYCSSKDVATLNYLIYMIELCILTDLPSRNIEATLNELIYYSHWFIISFSIFKYKGLYCFSKVPRWCIGWRSGFVIHR